MFKRVIPYFLLLICFLLFNSCNKNDDPSKISFYFNDAEVDAFESWLFVSDSNGETIGVMKVEKSGYAEISIPLTAGNVVVSELSYNRASSEFILFSYGDIPRGTVFRNHYNDPMPGPKGRAPITINDFSDSGSSLRCDDGSTATGYFTGNNDPFQVSANKAESNIRLAKDVADVLITGIKSGVHVYKQLKNVKLNERVSVSWNDFTPSKTISTGGKTLFSFYVVGYPENSTNGYRLSDYSQWPSGSVRTINYIEGYSRYVVHTQFPVTGGLIFVNQEEATPTTITYPDYTFTKSNGSVKDFTFSMSAPYSTARVIFRKDETSWYYFAPKDSRRVVLKIPEVIRKSYPDFSIDGLPAIAVATIQFRASTPSYLENITMMEPPIAIDYEFFF